MAFPLAPHAGRDVKGCPAIHPLSLLIGPMIMTEEVEDTMKGEEGQLVEEPIPDAPQGCVPLLRLELRTLKADDHVAQRRRLNSSEITRG